MADDETKKVAEPEKKWYQIAEVRMVMYVIPMGAALALIGFILSQIAHR
ncbi:MAG TPA: hypothetical protein VMC62_09950 [Longilinea sp.]|nr:hypothetical protein [Longilinea sp.]